jgi:hypothetical protein
MTSPIRSIDRRDAAITAALAGMVVIILGYASGVGLRPEAAVPATVQQPAAPSAIEPTTPVDPPPVAVAAPAPVVVPPAPIVQHGPVPTSTPTPTPSATPATTPSPAAASTCAPGLVSSLVGDLPLVGNVSGLLSGLIGTGGLLGSATTPASGATSATSATSGTDPLSCAVGALLGPSCCSAKAARTSARTR